MKQFYLSRKKFRPLFPFLNFANRTGELPANQTPQAPPKPTVTLSPSTMTGTCLLPLEYFNISSSFALFDPTSTKIALSPKASRALLVWGQLTVPKIITFEDISLPPILSSMLISY